jgi:hypothetical protein
MLKYINTLRVNKKASRPGLLNHQVVRKIRTLKNARRIYE